MTKKETTKIQAKAEELLGGLKWITRVADDKKIVVIDAESESQLEKDLYNLTFKIKEETYLGIDSVHEFLYEALTAIVENDDLENVSLQADVYTSDLTSWLAECVNHVDYITRAIEEFNVPDGFSALETAQSLAKQDVLDIVLNYLNK